MLELLNPKEEHRQLAEITRDAFKNLRLTQVVKKGNLKISQLKKCNRKYYIILEDFINGLLENKDIIEIMSSYE